MDIPINTIINESCMDVMAEMGDKSVDMVLTDIPYGEVTKAGCKREIHKGQIRKINKGNADIVTFDLTEFLSEVARVAKGSLYIFCGIEQVSTIYSFFKHNNDFITRQCAWKKPNPPPLNGKYMWLSSMENCIFAKRRQTVFNAEFQASVWEYATEPHQVYPAQKPVALFERLILASSNKGDLVFDPCMGSGTTAVAAINTNRNFFGCEVYEKAYDLAKERINDATAQLRMAI